MFSRAICRKPGPDFANGLTTSTEGKPEYDRLLEQHAAYVKALRELGLAVELLDPLPGHPDAYFVEDAAVLTPELALITRPGAPARRGEEQAMAPTLAKYLPLARIEAPGTLEGGDVLLVGRRFFIGLSERTNREGAEQMARAFEPHGYACTFVPVAKGLHFKSSVNWVGGKTLLLTEAFAGRKELVDFEHILVDPSEAYAGNTLWINGTLLTPKGYPGTRTKLERLGLPILELDTSEARKMDGGLTCMSLRF